MNILLNLLGGVALLLWGTHMVQAGITRVYGADLRRFIGKSLGSRFLAFLSGIGVTAVVQSSTATTMIVSSFSGQGYIATAPALAVLLGANVGTSLVAQVFAFDLGWLSPVLILAGVVLFLSRQNVAAGQWGRVLIGLGLMLLALEQIVAATRPVTAVGVLKMLLTSLNGQTGLAILLAAALTAFTWSSLATVLLVASLGAGGLISPHLALALILGVNLGNAIPVLMTTLTADPRVRRIPLGNFLFKLAGCLIFLPLLDPLQHLMALLDASPKREIINFHTLFNLALAALFIFATRPVARLCAWLLPGRPETADPATPRYLDPMALETPAMALSGAARETLRIADVVEEMLHGALTALQSNDAQLARRISRMDDTVDRLYRATKLYLTRISREALSDREGLRWAEIISFTINLEFVGDIIDKSLMELAQKKVKNRLSFSKAGMAEIIDFHLHVMDSMRLATSVFMTGDLKSAERLLAGKDKMRELEQAYLESHLRRLASQTLSSVETSSLHLDIIRDLKRINSHICSVAYPVLETAGELNPSRLKVSDPQAGEEDAASVAPHPSVSKP